MLQNQRPDDDLTEVGALYCHLTSNIARKVKLAFNLKKCKTPGNKIQWEVRKKMRDKDKWSKQILRTKDPLKIMELRELISKAEKEIKSSCNNVRQTKENKVDCSTSLASECPRPAEIKTCSQFQTKPLWDNLSRTRC